MMDLQKPRTFDDETLDMAASMTTARNHPGLVEWFQKVDMETARRSSIRLERNEYGTFTADWYESRQPSDEELAEADRANNLLEADPDTDQPEHECGPFPYLYMGCPGCQWMEDRA